MASLRAVLPRQAWAVRPELGLPPHTAPTGPTHNDSAICRATVEFAPGKQSQHGRVREGALLSDSVLARAK